MRFPLTYGILCCCWHVWIFGVDRVQAAIPIFTDNVAQISQNFSDLTGQVEILTVSSLPPQERENIAVNEEQTYQAFTICQPISEHEGCQEKIFIEEISTGKYYQIQGIPLSWRPFTNLGWRNETMLEFDRWSNPHYGLRYTVDMTEKKLVDITEFEQ